jgi:hypothetical protein
MKNIPAINSIRDVELLVAIETDLQYRVIEPHQTVFGTFF